MKKNFLFGITLLSAAVIIGTIITFINANSDQVSQNPSMRTEIDSTNIEQRLAELEKKVNLLETLTTTQNEEIISLQNQIKEKTNTKETTVIYKDNNSSKVSELDKKVNELEKKTNEQDTTEINEKVEKVSEEVKDISEDYYWLVGKWEGVNKTSGIIYQFDLRKDGNAYDKDGKKIGLWNDNKIYYNFVYNLYFRKLEKDKCHLISEYNMYNRTVTSSMVILKKVDEFSIKEKLPESISIEGKNEISLGKQEEIEINYNVKVNPSDVTDVRLADEDDVNIDNVDVADYFSCSYNQDKDIWEIGLIIRKTGEFTLTVTTKNGKTASIKVKVIE